MTAISIDQLFDQAMTLSEADRLLLAEQLQAGAKVDEVSHIDNDMDDAWLAKMRGRIERSKSGEARTYSSTEAKALLREHLDRRP